MNTSASPGTPKDSPRKRILVVDDDDAVRLGLDDVLVTEGYEVITAINGIQALAALRRQPCDLALLDMNMPLLNGWGTIGELRRLNRWLPIVIITARPDQGTLARETGVELMEKPLDLPLLLRRIEELLNPPPDTTRALPGESAAA
jgi:two-component system response regulator MprA